jgi:hypothetical protein
MHSYFIIIIITIVRISSSSSGSSICSKATMYAESFVYISIY